MWTPRAIHIYLLSCFVVPIGMEVYKTYERKWKEEFERQFCQDYEMKNKIENKPVAVK